MQNTQILLSSRPQGTPNQSNFRVVQTQVAALKQGEVLVQTLFLSLDPAMRGWMSDAKSYIPPVPLNTPMRAGGIGVVLESKHEKFASGDIVNGFLNWQSYAVINGKELTKLRPLPPPMSVTAYLSVLGGTGMTAYFGLLDVGKPKAGETVLVSGAAGATGSIVGQIAKIVGCRVVGIAGSDDKCKYLKDLGFDATINYKNVSNMSQAIKETCPKGVDVYFDNVGGSILDAALAKLNFKGRVVLCGAISQYNEPSGKNNTVQGPTNYLSLLVNRARMEGFIVFDYKPRFAEATMQLIEWISKGQLKYSEQFAQGLENAPDALLQLFRGDNTGKLILKIAHHPALDKFVVGNKSSGNNNSSNNSNNNSGNATSTNKISSNSTSSTTHNNSNNNNNQIISRL